LTTNEPVVNAIDPVTEKLMVSPLAEAAIVSRNEPAPLSFPLVTVRVAPKDVVIMTNQPIAPKDKVELFMTI
jgi:hypothetical protein